MDILVMLGQAYAETIEVAATVTSDDLDRPTPCPAWDIRALVNHFLWASAVLSESTTGKGGLGPSVLTPGMGPNSDLVGNDVAAAVARQLETALDYWQQPGALDTICHLPLGDIPGFFVAHFNLLDLYTHRWDLGRAVAHDVTMNHELAEAALSFAQGVLTDELRAQVGIATPVASTPGASPGDRLVAFMGRRP